MKEQTPIYSLKRLARQLAHEKGLKHHEALDQIASGEGFQSWSHLSAHRQLAHRLAEADEGASTSPAEHILKNLTAGDMVLIGARPGHGKTLLGLELAAMAGLSGRKGIVFSLHDNVADILARYETLGLSEHVRRGNLIVDTSDNICADYILDEIRDDAGSVLVVIDYMQLLDQRRCTPPLEEQVRVLGQYAHECGAVFMLLSQIDRSFELRAEHAPGLADIRLPNPLNLAHFTHCYFLHEGRLTTSSDT